MQLCKFCNACMMRECETLSNGNHYGFFSNCLKCGAICEGERKEKDRGKYIIFEKSRWFNPQTKEFEEWKVWKNGNWENET